MKAGKVFIVFSILHLMLIIFSGNALWAFQTGNPQRPVNNVNLIMPPDIPALMIPGEENVIPNGSSDTFSLKKDRLQKKNDLPILVKSCCHMWYVLPVLHQVSHTGIFIMNCALRN